MSLLLVRIVIVLLSKNSGLADRLDLKCWTCSGEYLVEKIRDAAGQKGTGKWTAIAALDYGIPVTLIGEAVFARCLSALQKERIEASALLPAPSASAYQGDRVQFIQSIKQVGPRSRSGQPTDCSFLSYIYVHRIINGFLCIIRYLDVRRTCS